MKKENNISNITYASNVINKDAILENTQPITTQYTNNSKFEQAYCSRFCKNVQYQTRGKKENETTTTTKNTYNKIALCSFNHKPTKNNLLDFKGELQHWIK